MKRYQKKQCLTHWNWAGAALKHFADIEVETVCDKQHLHSQICILHMLEDIANAVTINSNIGKTINVFTIRNICLAAISRCFAEFFTASLEICNLGLETRDVLQSEAEVQASRLDE